MSLLPFDSIDQSLYPEMRKITRKNPSEECEQELLSRGYSVTKRGWPDFIGFRDDRAVFVEVKRKSNRLKREQRRVMRLLSRAGFKCMKYSPDAGFVPFRDERSF